MPKGDRARARQNLVAALGFEVVIDSSELERVKKEMLGFTTSVSGSFKGVGAAFGKTLSGLKSGKLAGIAAGVAGAMAKKFNTAFKQFVFRPITGFFTSLPTMMRQTIGRGATYIQQTMGPALSLSLKSTQDFNSAWKDVRATIFDATKITTLMPEQLLKMLSLQTRMLGTTKGFSRNMESIAGLTFLTGENSEEIFQMIQEWTKAFKVTDQEGIQQIISDLVQLRMTLGLTVGDIRDVATWFLPMFTTQFGQNKKQLETMISLVGAIAELGTGKPIQAREVIRGIFEGVMQPTEEIVSNLAGMGILLYESGTSGKRFANEIMRAGKEIKKLVKEQGKLARQMSLQRVDTSVYNEKMQEIEDRLKAQKSRVGSLIEVWKNSGARMKPILDILKELKTAQDKVSGGSLLWGDIMTDLAGTSTGLFNIVIDSAGRIEKILANLETISGDIDEKVREAAKLSGKYWIDSTKATYDAILGMMAGAFGDPLLKSVGRGLNTALSAAGEELTDFEGEMGKGVERMSKLVGDYGKRFIEPLISDLGKLAFIAFDPEATEVEVATLQASIKEKLTGLTDRIGVLLAPVTEILSKGLTNMFTSAFESIDVDEVAKAASGSLINIIGASVKGIMWKWPRQFGEQTGRAAVEAVFGTRPEQPFTDIQTQTHEATVDADKVTAAMQQRQTFITSLNDRQLELYRTVKEMMETDAKKTKALEQAVDRHNKDLKKLSNSMRRVTVTGAT